MKKILFVLIISFLFFSCVHGPVNENGFHVKFTDLKGEEIKETYSGQVIKLTSPGFGNLSPNNIPNNAQLFFDNVPVQIQQAGSNFVIVTVPVMHLADYKLLTLRFSVNQLTTNMIERILYRPTVTGEVFAGFGKTSPDGTFQMPAEMTIDASGNLYVIDQRTSHDVIIKVTPAGVTSVFAGAANEFGRLVGLDLNLAGTTMYVSDATAQQVKKFNMASPSSISILAGSGATGNTDGTGAAASFNFGNEMVNSFTSNERGQGLVVDSMGNVYAGEKYGTVNPYHSQVRKITPSGVVTFVPGSRVTPDDPLMFTSPSGITLNGSNQVVYVCGSSGFIQGMIWIISATARSIAAGHVTFESLNDGNGASADFAFPKAIQYFSGSYYIADGTNGALRKAGISTSGFTADVITLAGVGHVRTPSFCTCGISVPRDSSYVMPSLFFFSPDKYELAASAIMMDQVGGVAVKNPGLIYLSDYGVFKCIWRIRIE